MSPHFSTPEEKSKFLLLSNTIELGNYKEALDLSKEMLLLYPDNKHIYYNQIGALTYAVTQNYWEATKNYYMALEHGFNRDTCEENIWESAYKGYAFLIDEEQGFCSIKFPDGPVSSISLIEKYQHAFPEGKYIPDSMELVFIYELANDMDRECTYNEYGLKTAYFSEFDGKYLDIVNRVCMALNFIPVVEMRSHEASLKRLFPDGPAETGTDPKTGLRTNTYINGFGKYIIMFIDDAIHKVIYQLVSETEEEMKDKYFFMLGHYKEDSKWKLLADNGTVYIITREDGKLHATYSYIMDIWTIMTSEFHEGYR
jgi:hypothetical protein